MIKIRIKNADHEIDIRFPISESELFAKLGEIHAVEGRDAAQSALVTDVYWPEEFSMLKDRFANLDELNYLGKRMESFDTLEYDQFLIGISKLDSKDVKDLINLTFNLNHFTLCQDVSSYGKIGREYVLNTEGAVPAHDEDDPKYATIGKDLIDRGLAQITERGLLIYNPFDELEEVYDGHTFPEYYYNNSLLSLNAEYGGRTELLQLPDEALAIKKAIDRLGAPSAEDCSYTVTFHNFKGEEELCSLKLPDSLQPNDLHFFFWKTSRDCYRMTGARRLKPSTPRLLKWGIILNGVCITADISESPSSDGACILSDILIPDVPDKYFLSAAAMRRISGNLSAAPRGKGFTIPTE